MGSFDIKGFEYVLLAGIGAIITAAGALTGMVLSLILFHVTGDWHFGASMIWSIVGVWTLMLGYITGNLVQTFLEDQIGVDVWAMIGIMIATTSAGVGLAALGYFWSLGQHNPLTFARALAISEAGAWAFLITICLFVIHEKRSRPHD